MTVSDIFEARNGFCFLQIKIYVITANVL